MRKIYIPLVTAALLSSQFASAAPHDRGFFVGGNLGYVITEDLMVTGVEEDEINFRAYEINFGYKYNNWLGVDIRFGSGLTDRSFDNTGGGDTEFGLGSYSAIYFRPEITNNDARLYFLIGQTSFDVTSVNIDSTGASSNPQSGSYSGASYGMGAGWYNGPDFSVNLELRKLMDDEDGDFSSVHLGFDYRFDIPKIKKLWD